VGRDDDSHGPTLPQRPGFSRKEILALCTIRRATSSDQCRASAGPHRGCPYCGYERIEFLGRIRSPFSQYAAGLPRSRAGKKRTQVVDARGRQGGYWAWGAREALEIGGGEL